jgi:hypothetical protein
MTLVLGSGWHVEGLKLLKNSLARSCREKHREENMPNESVIRKSSKDEIMAAIQECAAKLGRAPTRTELLRVSALSPTSIDRQFGNYTNAVRACGLEREGGGIPVALDNLFRDWARIVREMGKVPTVVEYGQRSNYSQNPLRHRFRSWNLVPSSMIEYARENGLEQQWADVLEIAEKRCRRGFARGFKPTVPAMLPLGTTILKDRPVYGASLIGQAMCFAPVNEMGVVFLFGAMASQLGFMVTWVGTQFPDIEAIREVEPGRWQRSRIEVEFQSRNFLQHFHDPKECDLIVCWEHNWPECPLEVIELKGLIGKSGDRG